MQNPQHLQASAFTLPEGPLLSLFFLAGSSLGLALSLASGSNSSVPTIPGVSRPVLEARIERDADWHIAPVRVPGESAEPASRRADRRDASG